MGMEAELGVIWGPKARHTGRLKEPEKAQR